MLPTLRGFIISAKVQFSFFIEVDSSPVINTTSERVSVATSSSLPSGIHAYDPMPPLRNFVSCSGSPPPTRQAPARFRTMRPRAAPCAR